MRQIFPAAGPELPVSPVTAEVPGPPAVAALASLYAYPDSGGQPGPPWVRANMISSADGAATLDGRSGGLSGRPTGWSSPCCAAWPMSSWWARAPRGRSGTARSSLVPSGPGSGWPRQAPRIAVVTSRLGPDLDDLLLAPAAGGPSIVLTTEAVPEDRRAAVARRANVIVAGSTTVDPAAAIGALARLGLTRILVEGGPQLLGQLFTAGLVDDLCLTVSPVVAAGHAIRITNSAAETGGTALDLAHVLADDGQLICRYLRQPAVTG